MPQVTHVFKTYFPETSGGLEEAIRQCAVHAAAKGFTVKVVSVGPADYTVTSPEGICTQFYKKTWDFFSNPFSVSFARAFSDISRHTDLLHFHFPWPTAEMLALVHAQKTPSLVTFHCDIHRMPALKTLYLPFVRRFLHKMDCICVTSWQLFYNTPYLAPFAHKIREIPLFMNEQRFAGLGPVDPALAASAGKKPFALFVGVLRWYKGLDILLDAAKTTHGDIRIAGTGPLLDKLAARIRNENLTNVHLMGFQSDADLAWLIQNARMVVLPSITAAEAFGQVLLEGLYFQKPLVSTSLGTGTSVVNRHGYTGLVVPPGCSRSLTLAMNTLFSDNALCKRFSQNAQHHYAAHFTPAAQGQKYLEIYRSLLN
ncbi:MAG: glycosyltransferase [Desulfobacteraceae bacterium]|nr:glycosyltransferase [Desulfobacteraceae bacterium]